MQCLPIVETWIACFSWEYVSYWKKMVVICFVVLIRCFVFWSHAFVPYGVRSASLCWKQLLKLGIGGCLAARPVSPKVPQNLVKPSKQTSLTSLARQRQQLTHLRLFFSWEGIVAIIFFFISKSMNFRLCIENKRNEQPWMISSS